MVTSRISGKARYDQLIYCAARVFAKKGYKGATTIEISKAAKVSERMIYVHFKSKKELYIKCLAKIAEELRLGFRQILNDNKNEPLKFLEKTGLFFFDYISNNPYAGKLLSINVQDINDKHIIAEYRKIIELAVDTVERSIKMAIEKGIVQPHIDPRAAAWVFVGSYNTFLIMQYFKFEEGDREFAERMINLIFKFL